MKQGCLFFKQYKIHSFDCILMKSFRSKNYLLIFSFWKTNPLKFTNKNANPEYGSNSCYNYDKLYSITKLLHCCFIAFITHRDHKNPMLVTSVWPNILWFKPTKFLMSTIYFPLSHIQKNNSTDTLKPCCLSLCLCRDTRILTFRLAAGRTTAHRTYHKMTIDENAQINRNFISMQMSPETGNQTPRDISFPWVWCCQIYSIFLCRRNYATTFRVGTLQPDIWAKVKRKSIELSTLFGCSVLFAALLLTYFLTCFVRINYCFVFVFGWSFVGGWKNHPTNLNGVGG